MTEIYQNQNSTVHESWSYLLGSVYIIWWNFDNRKWSLLKYSLSIADKHPLKDTMPRYYGKQAV